MHTATTQDAETFCNEQEEPGAMNTVHKSILQAIRQGEWDFEPSELLSKQYDSTFALPGSDEKLAILAERAQRGLPLWHDEDRRCYDDGVEV